MGFVESYKHLEKICGEILNDDRRLSAYIDEMINTPNGAFYVKGWNNDLKQLKHYRWIRNQIVHEPGCTEQNMCAPQDAAWLDEFYMRIINQTDPIAQYYKASRTYKTPYVGKTNKIPESHSSVQQNDGHKNQERYWSGYIAFLLVVLFIYVVIAVLKSF